MLAAYQRVLLAWPTLLGLILVVILFVPIRRYTVGGGLPFELEPYRVLIVVVLACWVCAVAADPRVRARATGLEAPIAALLLAMLLSMAVNLPRVNAAGATVIKDFTFFVSYVLVIYFIVERHPLPPRPGPRAPPARGRRHVWPRPRSWSGAPARTCSTGTAASRRSWTTSTRAFRRSEVLAFAPAAPRSTRSRPWRGARHAESRSLVYLYRRSRRVPWLGCAGYL